MSRLMSVAFTEHAVRDRSKTVTRRLGWLFTKPGDRLTLCRKVMGRRKGEPLVRIAEVEIVSVRRERGCEAARVGFAVIGERWTEDVQLLLGVLGIYSRRSHKTEKRADRHDLHEVAIAIGSERARFAELVGFVDGRKQGKLLESLDLRNPKRCPDLREEEIVAIEALGELEVYEILTESGEFENSCSSSTASRLTKCGGRRRRRLDSTARSLAPARSAASGCSASSATQASTVTGLENPAIESSRRRGAGRLRRRLNSSSGAGPSAWAASRIGRYPVHRHRLPSSARVSHCPARSRR